jgi:hypothetical protein
MNFSLGTPVCLLYTARSERRRAVNLYSNMNRFIVGWLGLLLLALPAPAWNSLGHRAVAEVAWRNMDEAERKAATDLLKQHPHYKQLLSLKAPDGADPDEWAFLTGAIWPDLIRPAKKGAPSRPESITRYNVYAHSIGLPVVRASDAGAISISDFGVSPRSAVAGITNSLAVLRNKEASPHDRAVALTWVLHLVGDLHQPLHASTLVTRDKPKGNGGGGVFVVLDVRGKIVNLHSYWDWLPGRDGSYQGISALADALATPELRTRILEKYRQNGTVLSWAREGQQVAAEFAYAQDRIDLVLEADVTSKKIARAQIPKLSSDYNSEAERIARERLALASLRLTDLMKELF